MTAFASVARSVARGALIVLAAGACATAGSTVGSGVGDALLSHPPYYAGGAVPRDTATRIVHFPIRYQRGASQADFIDPAEGGGTPVAAMLAEMNAYLDSLGATARVTSAGAPRGTPPDVRFGCETEPAGDECTKGSGGTLATGARTPRMYLAVGRPSADWVAWAAEAMGGANASHALVLTLEIGQYVPRQTGLLGKKEVELGTGHTADVPWLTSLETPVSVLQLTGALVGRDGRAVRIGAEGIFPRRTRLLVSAVRAQEVITNEDVEAARAARRADLPGQPLAWQAALRRLVAELTGRPALAQW